MITVSLIVLAALGWVGIIGTNIQAFRHLNDSEEFHRVAMRSGVYAIGTAIALGFLGMRP